MARITRIHAREVPDSRGNPTVEVEVACGDGPAALAIVPSGASTGRAEACELRDGDLQRYDGRGVLKAVANVNDAIAPALVGRDAADQPALDAALLELDGTPRKTRLGANALLGVSLAAAKAAAAAQGAPLYEHVHRLWSDEFAGAAPPRMPTPMTNMISGGLHAGGNLEFQDFLISTGGAPNYSTALEWIVRVYRRLGQRLSAAGFEARLVADEGGYGPKLASNRQAAEMVVRAMEEAGLRPGEDVTLALDVAASHFYRDGRYHLASHDEPLTSGEMAGFIAELADSFPISSIEDPLAEEDWDGWRELNRRLQGRVTLIGDDLFATNPARVKKGIELAAATGVLIKPNQIGTLSETLQTMRIAAAAGLARVVSARSGETEDSTIADLAVGTAAEGIKIGAITRGERLAKYNRLLRIEEELASKSD